MTDLCSVEVRFSDPFGWTTPDKCNKCIKSKDKIWEIKVKRTNFYPGKNEGMFVRITTFTESSDWENNIFEVPVRMKFSLSLSLSLFLSCEYVSTL